MTNKQVLHAVYCTEVQGAVEGRSRRDREGDLDIGERGEVCGSLVQPDVSWQTVWRRASAAEVRRRERLRGR
eukprot:718436-Hanusia_phi.AAC.1